MYREIKSFRYKPPNSFIHSILIVNSLHIHQGNDLVDIRPLRLLPSLRELDLRDNSVVDLSALEGLLELQMLHLDNNQLKDINVLHTLQKLKNLKVVTLKGNPVCDTIGYPYTVFNILPSVIKIDDIDRDNILKTSNDKVKTVPKHDPVDNVVVDDSKIKSLQRQVESLETAFEMQEKILGVNGLHAGATLEGSADKNVEVTEVSTYPYVKLMQFWRQQVVTITSDKKGIEEELTATNNQLKAMTNNYSNLLNEHNLSSIQWTQRNSSLIEKVNGLKVTLQSNEDKVQQDSLRLSELERDNSKYKNYLSELKNFVLFSKGQIESRALTTNVELMKYLNKIKLLEEKLENATARVSFATSIIAQKEIMLKNSIAALDAERVMLTSAYNSYKKGEIIEGGDSSMPLLSNLQISAEAEGILQAIFRGLDPNDTGTVTVSFLLDVLCGDDDNEQSCSDIFGGTLELSYWNSLINKLRAMPRDRELTWGEFLLQLFPDQPDNRVPLSAKDMYELKASGVLGGADWGVPPIRYIIEMEKTASATSSETSRLRAERSYLLTRIQNMNRTLERRAEGIKTYFINDLRKCELRESRLTVQNKELKDALALMESRILDLETRNATDRQTWEVQLKESERECDHLRNVVKSKSDENTTKYGQILADEKAQYTRLETEYNLLSRENSKKEVRIKGLQRDITRLQSALTAALDDKKKDDAKNVSELDALNQQIAVLQEQNNNFLGTITELEKKLEQLKRPEPVVTHVVENTDRNLQLSGDGVDSLQQQMALIRSLPMPVKSSVPPAGSSQNDAALPPSSDVYAAQLAKLLRLAEDAISNS